ncbi:MAG: 3-keto-5-aminohexanoate cleavage protein [Pseudomonadota bacterium]
MIMVAPNGARRQTSDHPALPVTAEAVADTAAACAAAGADAVHVHVREDDGSHSLDTGRYRDTLAALAERAPSLRVQITTESAGVFSPSEQLACLLDLAPAWASVSVREIAADDSVADRLYRACIDQGTEVQHILYSPACAAQLARWWSRGVVDGEQNSVIHVLGHYTTGEQGDPASVAARSTLPGAGRWMVCAFGDREHDCLVATHRAGGDVRVGFENSLGRGGGHRWTDNAESVAALRRALDAHQEPNA